MAALVTSVLGWARLRPSLEEVARLGDLRLGGRERLSTALQLAGGDGRMVTLQRADAEAWARHVDPARIVPEGWRRGVVTVGALGVVAAVLAFGLSRLDNPVLAGREAQRAERQARHNVANQIEDMAEVVNLATPGGPDRDALVRELRGAAAGVRGAQDAAAALAALSGAQHALRPLVDAAAARQQAASAAGSHLAQSRASAAAGGALVRADQPSEVAQIAAALAGLGAEGRRQLGAQLEEVAAAASDPATAEQLRRAASALAAGQLEQAAAAIAATREQGTAAEELAQLAASLPMLSAIDQAELAQALQRAAAAAAADPELARQLRDAGSALQSGDSARAAAALQDAAASQQERQRQRQAAAESVTAGNRLEDLKRQVLAGKAHLASADAPLADEAGDGAASAPDAAGGGQAPAAGGGAGQRGGEGSGGEGSGGGAGNTSAAAQSGGGLGGPGGGSGVRAGGGSVVGGSRGNLQGPPGAPSEQVYVPGVFSSGRVVDLPSSGEGPGGISSLVPYETVYAQYRAAALSQVDRAVMPSQVQDLLRRYFQDLPG